MASKYYTVRIPKRTFVRRKSAGPKAFKSLEKAQTYAKANGLTDVEFKNLRAEGQRPKFKIVKKL